MNLLPAISFVALIILAGPVHAEMRNITLTVPMTCPAADPMVYERVMTNIPGVNEAKARYDDLSLFVMFDDTQTGLEDILGALSDLGVDAEVRN